VYDGRATWGSVRPCPACMMQAPRRATPVVCHLDLAFLFFVKTCELYSPMVWHLGWHSWMIWHLPGEQRRNQKFWIRGAEQILYTIREKHIKIYIRVTNILDRENALHMFCLHFTTSQTYCEFVFSFFHKIISNVFVFLVWPCFLKKIITYSLRPTKSVVLGNFRHITYLNKWLCYP